MAEEPSSESVGGSRAGTDGFETTLMFQNYSNFEEPHEQGA